MLARLYGKARIGNVIMFICLMILAIMWMVPLWLSFVTSLKYEAEIFRGSFTWIPLQPTWFNYDFIFGGPGNVRVFNWIFNSAVIATTHTILLLIICSLAAYAYARLEFKGRTFLFTTLMATMMIPGVINFIPNFIIVDRLGWLDTHFAMIFPGLSGVFGVFLLRQFFLGIPKEIEESARIDGASEFKIYSHLFMPLSKPALVALGILTFLGNWNDYLWPLLVTFRHESLTLTVGVALLSSQYGHHRGVVLAGASIGAIPPLILFIIGQRQFVKGITFSAVKG